MCMAMKSPKPGKLLISAKVKANSANLASRAKVKIEIANAAIKTFQALDMISVSSDGLIEVVNFGTHQDLNRLQAIRLLSAKRSAKYRDNRNKALLERISRDESRDENVIITTKSKSKRESKSEIKNKEKEKPKISPTGEWAETVLDPFWQTLKKLNLLPIATSKRDSTFHALRAILLRYPLPESQYVLKDGEELSRRWLTHISAKGKLPLGENNRIRWAVGEIEMSLEAIARFGLARCIEDLEWAINDESFWAAAFLSLKNFPMIQAKAAKERTA